MKENYKSYDIPATTIGNKTFIDANMLHLLLTKIDEPKVQEPEQETHAITASEFKSKVYQLWSECIVQGPMPWQNKNSVIGEALMVDYPFDQEKIALHASEILGLISKVHHAATYEEMKFLDNGEQWSTLRQPVSFLMALGNALKLVDFKNSRLDWNEEESKNPEIKFTLK